MPVVQRLMNKKKFAVRLERVLKEQRHLSFPQKHVQVWIFNMRLLIPTDRCLEQNPVRESLFWQSRVSRSERKIRPHSVCVCFPRHESTSDLSLRTNISRLWFNLMLNRSPWFSWSPLSPAFLVTHCSPATISPCLVMQLSF
jgi:hypothetical protein